MGFVERGLVLVSDVKVWRQLAGELVVQLQPHLRFAEALGYFPGWDVLVVEVELQVRQQRQLLGEEKLAALVQPYVDGSAVAEHGVQRRLHKERGMALDAERGVSPG